MIENSSHNFCIGGIPLRVRIKGESSWQIVPQLLGFLASGDPVVDLRVSFTSWPELDKLSLIFESGANWALYQLDTQRVLCVRTLDDETYGIGVFSEDFCQGNLYFRRNQVPSYCVSDPLLRPMGDLLFVNLLGKNRGALLHACSVKCLDTGFVFVGQGGAGKSTTARLWSSQCDCVVFGDDRVILRQDGDQFSIYGTPWPGTQGISSPGQAPLHRVYFLRQARENRVSPLQPREVVSRLMVASFLARWDSSAIAYSMALFENLARQVPCFELAFTPDQQMVDFVRSQLG